MAFLLATQFTAVDYAAASLGTDNFNSVTGLSGAFNRDQGRPLPAKDKWYSLSKTVTLAVLEQVGSQDNLNISNNRLVLTEGTEVHILDLSPDKRFALIGIDEDGFDENNPGINGADPVIAWVDLGELSRAGLQSVDSEGIEIFGLSQFAQNQPSDFVSTEVAARRGGRARARGGRGRRGGGGMTYCLRDVRLHAARYTSRVPQNIPMASMAYPRYKAAGWRSVAYSPSNPLGTACFMGGGRSCGKGKKCGHAAIKISSNAWKGAGVRPTPFLPNSDGKVYHFQGCLVPPGR